MPADDLTTASNSTLPPGLTPSKKPTSGNTHSDDLQAMRKFINDDSDTDKGVCVRASMIRLSIVFFSVSNMSPV